MRIFGISLLILTAAVFAIDSNAQQPPPAPAIQIAAAVTPAPEDLRDGASVLGYSEGGELVSLKKGDGDLLCLADNPADERFHVACYFEQLDPFMARGRELRAEGKNRDEITAIREAEIKDGKLTMPSQPTALYSYTGPAGSFDPETGTVTGANRVYVVYTPYETTETTGLSSQPTTGAPWLMASGKPWAHIMLVQPPPAESNDD